MKSKNISWNLEEVGNESCYETESKVISVYQRCIYILWIVHAVFPKHFKKILYQSVLDMIFNGSFVKTFWSDPNCPSGDG